jgi:hypothetical protein
VALLALDTFVAVSTIGGGIALIARIDTFPRDWLKGSPFTDYAWPGVILVCVGACAAIATVAAWRRARAWAPASVAAGLILGGWMAGELVLLNQNGATTSPRGPFEAIYVAVAAAMVLLGTLAWRSRSRPAGV